MKYFCLCFCLIVFLAAAAKAEELSGEWKFEEMIYKNGRKCGQYKNYYWGVLPWKKKRNGKLLHEFSDYDKKFEGKEGTHYVEVHDKNGSIVFSGYNRNGERGWTLYAN